MTDDKLTTATEIARELRSATAQLQAAQETANAARRAETDLINRVNTLQGKFDKAVADLKAGAPYGTDWTRTARIKI